MKKTIKTIKTEKTYIGYDKTGKIISVVTTNDKTLVTTDMIEIKDNDLFKEVANNTNEYTINTKDKKLKYHGKTQN